MVYKLRIVLFYIIYKGRAAGRSFPTFFFHSFCQFFCLKSRYHISTDGSFYHIIETKFLDTCVNLFCLYALELTGNSRRNNSVNMIAGVIPGVFQQIQHIHNKRFIYNGAKRTLINTCTAGNTFFMVNDRFSIFIYFHCTYGAGTNARAFYFTDGVERANLFTTTTFDTKFLIDV